MLIVDDPDAVFSQEMAAGAVVRSPMEDRDYGWRDGSVTDHLDIAVKSVAHSAQGLREHFLNTIITDKSAYRK